MSGSGREVLPDVREWSRNLSGCLGVVRRPSRMSTSGGRPSRISGSGWETLLDDREWSLVPTGYPGMVWRPHGCSGSPPGCPGMVTKPSWVVGRPARMSGCGRESLQHVLE